MKVRTVLISLAAILGVTAPGIVLCSTTSSSVVAAQHAHPNPIGRY